MVNHMWLRSLLAELATLYYAATGLQDCGLGMTAYECSRASSLLWKDWQSVHDKVYATAHEELYRRSIFMDNLAFIRAHNDGGHSYELGLNEFADQTHGEFKAERCGCFNASNVKHPPKRRLVPPARIQRRLDAQDPPAAMDWRDKGAVTDVKDQGQCGSCWAFSATGSLEAAHFLKHGELVSLSEQQLMDCSTDQGDESCNGGLMDYAFKYVEEKGICAESDYPYKAKDEECQTDCQTKDKIASFVDVPAKDEEALRQAVANVGPVSVAIEADLRTFQFYKTGVYDDVRCLDNLDHGVLAVGYGSVSGKDYWIVKNSWGKTWGDKGYILIARGHNRCGIAEAASYPVDA